MVMEEKLEDNCKLVFDLPGSLLNNINEMSGTNIQKVGSTQDVKICVDREIGDAEKVDESIKEKRDELREEKFQIEEWLEYIDRMLEQNWE